LPQTETADAWRNILKREPRCLEWSESEVRELVAEDRLARTLETIRKISCAELMRFRIGQDGMDHRVVGSGDCAVSVACEREKSSFRDFHHRVPVKVTQAPGAKRGLIVFGHRNSWMKRIEPHWETGCVVVHVPMPEKDFAKVDPVQLFDTVTRVAVKLVMNALSTCTMVRLGRVTGNYMVWVVPSNLKLIDRATRYITKLTDLTYEQANQLLFEVIEYVEPRMKSDQAYPPVVGMAVLRAKSNLTNEEAEKKLLAE